MAAASAARRHPRLRQCHPRRDHDRARSTGASLGRSDSRAVALALGPREARARGRPKILTPGGAGSAPGLDELGYSSWFISPAYVNEDATERSRRGCFGGPVINVDVDDRLELDMRLEGRNWIQKVVDLESKKMTDFAIDLSGQPQQRALFWIEIKNTAEPVSDLIFEKTVLTMKTPEPGACELNNRGTRDYASKARVSADGRHCCIDRIVLRAEGVTATTVDP